MRLKMLQTLSGPACLYQAGHTYEVPDPEGIRLVGAGVAEDAAKAEAADTAPVKRGDLRVVMLQTLSGPTGVWLAGRHYVLPMDEAQRLVEHGVAQVPGQPAKGTVPQPPPAPPPAPRAKATAPASSTAAAPAPETTAAAPKAPEAPPAATAETTALPPLPTNLKDLRDLWMAEVGVTVPMPKGPKGMPTVATLTEGLKKNRAARKG